MILFDNNGHLTQNALNAIINGTLNEMQSLEASEHLSFCDKCLDEYTLLLTNNIMLAPPENLKQSTIAHIKKRVFKILFNKYTTYAVAACLAITFWSTGVFTQMAKAPAQIYRYAEAESLKQAINEKATDFWENANNILNDYIFK